VEIFRLIVEIVGGLGVIAGFVYFGFKWVMGLIDGQKALLRAEMLKIYYKYKDTKEIPQYSLECFHRMLEAYKNLKGNSFIDDVAAEVESWTMI